MTNQRIIQASTTIVYVNTAIDSNAIVLISTPTYFGQTISVRDIAGSAAATIPITISTTSTLEFYNSLSSFLIQQPLGSLTFSAAASNLWQIQNTFGHKDGQLPTVATLNQPEVSSILFKDSSLPGATDFLTTDDTILILNSNYLGDSNNVKVKNVNSCNIVLSDSSMINKAYIVGGKNSPGNAISYSSDLLNWTTVNNNFGTNKTGGTITPGDFTVYNGVISCNSSKYSFAIANPQNLNNNFDVFIYGSDNGVSFLNVGNVYTFPSGNLTDNIIIKYLRTVTLKGVVEEIRYSILLDNPDINLDLTTQFFLTDSIANFSNIEPTQLSNTLSFNSMEYTFMQTNRFIY